MVSIKNIFTKNYVIIPIPTTLALIATIISIIIKEMMYWYTRGIAKKIGSDSLMADAWHHRSDALSSIGSLIGIIRAILDYKLLDSIASIVICMCIIKVVLDIFIYSIDKMIDKSCSSEFTKKLEQIVLKVNGVKKIDSLKTRLLGSKVYIDIEISADENLTLKESHQIAQNVHDYVENNFHDVKPCMVYMNPKELE